MPTSITNLEICREVAKDLQAYVPLIEYFQNNFTSDVTFKIGEDARDPNGRKDCPFVTVIPGSSSVGMTEGVHDWEIMIHVGIISDGYSDPNSDHVSEMDGLELMDNLFQLIRAALEAMDSNLVPDRIDFVPNHTEHYPMHLGLISVAYRMSNVLSGTVAFKG